MGLFKKEEVVLPSNLLCYSGYTCCERVLIANNNPEYCGGWTTIEIGYKTFHCTRRLYTHRMTSSCVGCKKDMTPGCFTIHKRYYSPELIDNLIRVYEDNAKIQRGCDVVWWDNKWYNNIIKLIENPVQPKIETHAKGGKIDDDIPF